MHNGTTVVIKQIDTSVRLEKVSNFTVANTHNDFVGGDGVLVHNAFGDDRLPAQKSQKGVTPAPRERQVAHIIPKAKRGDGSFTNGQVLCRKCNPAKWDN